LLPQVDKDGAKFETTLFTGDSLAFEILKILEVEYNLNSWSNKTLYESKCKTVYISSNRYQKSLQFKGAFFLTETPDTRILKVISLLKKRGIRFAISRIDLSLISNQANFIKSFQKIDFKTLTNCLFSKKGNLQYAKSFNSRFSAVCYNKTNQIKKLKDSIYSTNFLKFYGLTVLPDELYNFELRLLGRDTCSGITEEFLKPEPSFEVMKDIIIAQSLKRISPSKKLQKLLLKTTI
jgi:hypothetical protein